MLWEIKTHLALISCASKQEEKKIIIGVLFQLEKDTILIPPTYPAALNVSTQLPNVLLQMRDFRNGSSLSQT